MFVFQKSNLNFLSGETPDGKIFAERGGERRYRYLSNGKPLFIALFGAHSFSNLHGIASGSAAVSFVPFGCTPPKRYPSKLFMYAFLFIFYIYIFYLYFLIFFIYILLLVPMSPVRFLRAFVL